MDSVREKTSASNEPICKKQKAKFLITQIAVDCSGIANECFDCNQLFLPWIYVFFLCRSFMSSALSQ